MTEELTLDDIMKYHKAEIISYNVSGGVYRKYDNIKCFMKVVRHDYNFYTNDFWLSCEIVLNDCKLILRDISQLTDAEKQEVDRLDDEGIYLSYGKRLVIDYLRSVSVDIDNFIASGKAVKDV